MDAHILIINKRNLIYLILVLFPASSMAATALREMSDGEMRVVAGQGLILNDKISGSNLENPNQYSTPFNFYRMGLNGELELNINLSKLQLGCGGVNDHLTGYSGCDLDIDYLSMMGRDGTEIGPRGSPFMMLRPYIEIAVKNDDTPTLREISGIKIGAESVDGALSLGRRYTQSGINQENTATGSQCDPSRVVNAVGCHSGINSVSGFLGSELSLTMDIEATILSIIKIKATGCTGRTLNTSDDCGMGLSDALFLDLAGTRMETLGIQAARLKTNNLELFGGSCSIFNPLACAAASIMDTVYASMSADLRNIHKMTLENTPDFFIAFQREPIAYPRYSKVSTNAELTGSEFDICNTSYATPRCASAYSVPANTGWWLNAPNVKLLDVYNPDANLGNLPVLDAISLLAEPGLFLENPEFNLTPQQNCYGSTTFC